MSKRLEQRVHQLEQTAGNRGMRVFFQDLDDKSLYREQNGAGILYSQADLDALSNEGWQVLRVVYE